MASCAGPDLRRAQTARDVFLQKYPSALHTTQASTRPLRYVTRELLPAKRSLLFIHGSPGNWEGWAEYLNNDDLAEHYQVIALDRPGYGGSLAGEPERSLSKQAEAVAQVLREVQSKGAPPAILVGHSYGGPVAVRTAIDFPDLIGGLILVAGAVSPALEETKWYQRVANWSWLRWLVPRDLDVCNQEILALKGCLEAMTSEWAKVRVHVYLLHGEKDPLVPVENVRFAKEHLTQAKSVEEKIVPGMNHFVPWEHPELILAAVDDIATKLAP